jgi:lysophospholipase L1-like esterase
MSPSLRQRHRARTTRAKIALGVLVAMLALGAVEIALRGIDAARPTPSDGGSLDPGLLAAHRTRLWAMKPGDHKNDLTTYAINELGLRGPRPAVPRPADTERILLLGDSTWFGFEVDDSATLAVRLEARLTQRGFGVDVVNAGVPGYSTEQTRVLLEEVGWSLEPTLLLIGNLWSDSSFDIRSDADLLHDWKFAAGILLARSALVRWLAAGTAWLKDDAGAQMLTWPTLGAAPESGQRRVPLRDYAANLDSMIRDARTRGVGVALLAPGNRSVVLLGPESPASWNVYFAAQERIAAHHGIPLVRGHEALRAAATTTGLEALFADDLHPSALGQEVLAAATEEVLVTAGWPGERLLGSADPLDLGVFVDDTPAHLRGAPPDRSVLEMLLGPSPPPAEKEPESGQGSDGSSR